MFTFRSLLTFRSLCLSGFVVSAALASMAQLDRTPEIASSYASRGLLSAQTDQSQDAKPYRGSGRRNFRDANVPSSSVGESL
ncbi:hypothetical protein IQ235_07815 [Oscillatoriales cyanobacterium LEGE 11467]|uniref:Uncharacterized protein n=1 Tax=Zarconia navalis LEGE 11467 TaxID=1828826 RepID=A0A928VUQ1_9CYAN|nr:hypothetical protein [Zarconia navalis]MBE9040684.1 hypothetical protein [Zarconia navalis LEGE 11467]